MSCAVPSFDASSWQPANADVHGVYKVPVSLVRDDGVIYSTDVSFSYTPHLDTLTNTLQPT